MVKNIFKKLNKKKYIFCYVIIVSMILNPMSVLADAFSEETIERPTAEDENSISKGIIYDQSKIEEYSPLHPTPSIANPVEYYSVNNYIVDMKTIETRVKYFSPTYLYAKNTAANTVLTSLYQAGGSATNLQTIRDTQKTLPSSKTELEKNYKTYSNQLSQLKKLGLSDTDPRVAALNSALTQIQTGIVTINTTSRTLYTAAAGYSKAIALVNNIDNNLTIVQVRQQIAKAMINAIVSYKQLELAVNIYEKQVNLYTRVYKTYEEQLKLDMITANELVAQRQSLNNAKKLLDQYRTLKNNTKELIALNLGYSAKDVDKLIIREPEIDQEYLNTIVLVNDYDKATNNNKTYQSIRNAGEDNKLLPDSTSRKDYNKILDTTKQKIIVALDGLYANLQVCSLKYEASRLQNEALNLSKAATKRKKEENLVSENEYEALVLQDLSTELSVKTAKYNFITAINNYYYGTCGYVDIE